MNRQELLDDDFDGNFDNAQREDTEAQRNDDDGGNNRNGDNGINRHCQLEALCAESACQISVWRIGGDSQINCK
jgi:hypothetical protein